MRGMESSSFCSSLSLVSVIASSRGFNKRAAGAISISRASLSLRLTIWRIVRYRTTNAADKLYTPSSVGVLVFAERAQAPKRTLARPKPGTRTSGDFSPAPDESVDAELRALTR